MKEHFSKFTCDLCGEQAIIKDDTGFPHNKGWSEIENISGKASTNPTSKIQDAFEEFEEKDKHFCSNRCAKEFVNGLFNTQIKSQPAKPSSINRANLERFEDLPDDDEDLGIPKKLKYETVDDEESSDDLGYTPRDKLPKRRQYRDEEEFIEPKPPQDTSGLQKPEPKKRKGLFRW